MRRRKSNFAPAATAIQLLRAALLFTLLLIALSIGNAEEIHGCSAINARPVSLDGHWVLMREDGKILTSEPYCGAGEYSDGLIAFASCNHQAFTFLTPEGKPEVKVEATRVGDFSQGLAAVEIDGKAWGYVNKVGERVIAPRFTEASSFSEGLAAVSFNNQWQYIDQTGKTVLWPSADGLTVFSVGNFRFGSALIVMHDPHTEVYLKGLVDRSGKWIIQPTQDLVGEAENGLLLFASAHGKVGFMDRTGRIVIDARFSGTAILPFQESLAAVYVGENPSLSAGFIDEHGQWVIPPHFSGAYHFCNGLAPVKSGDKWGFIDSTGAMVISPQFAHAESFEGGIAEVLQKDKSGKLHRELINRKGKVLYQSSAETQIVVVDSPIKKK